MTPTLANEIDHLRHVIDRDRYVVAAVIGTINRAVSGHLWLLEGHGPYEWDDDRYREEFADVISNIETALKPLYEVAWDKSDCTNLEERIVAAKHAARDLLLLPHRPRDMIAADLGLPCPVCNKLPGT